MFSDVIAEFPPNIPVSHSAGRYFTRYSWPSNWTIYGWSAWKRASARIPYASRNLARKITVDICHARIMARIRRYVGINESTPTTAPPSTSRAGLTLYCSKIIRTPTAIAAVSTPKIAPFAIVKQPASRSPIETGASPC
jgi:hypothetical protein